MTFIPRPDGDRRRQWASLSARRLRRALQAVIEPLEGRVLMSAGDLDTTFGAGGIAIYSTAGTNDDAGSAMAVQADGKILIGGASGANGSDGDFLLLRYDANGTLDSTFGNSGAVETTFSDVAQINAIAIQSDGKILAGGQIGTDDGSDWILARYNPDGTLDTTFNGTGYLTHDFFGHGDALEALSIQPSDGKIVATGVAADGTSSELATVRFNTDGSLDTTFGANGVAIADFFGGADFASDVLAQGDGGIIVAGGSATVGGHSDFALVRYNADGTLDNSFGNSGKAWSDFGVSATARRIVQQSDGKYVVGGLVGGSGNTQQWAVARYNADGSLDTTFGAGGPDALAGTTVLADLSGLAGAHYGMALQSDGEIVFGGYVQNTDGSGTSDFGAARFTDSGALDTSFGGTGEVRTDVGALTAGSPGASAGADLAITSSGDILMTGDDYRGAADGEDVVTLSYIGSGAASPASATLNNGVLTVTGTASNDSVILSATGGTFTAAVNGVVNTFTNPVTSISVSLLGGNDSLLLNGGVPGGSADLGDGDDEVHIASGNLSGNLNILGGNGNDAVSVDDSALGVSFDGGAGFDSLTHNSGAAGDSTMVSATQIAIAGSGTISYSNLESLAINGGGGDDSIDVESANVPLTIAGGAGSDSLSLGSSGGDLGLITAPITFDGGDGADDSIQASDDMTTLGQAYSLTSTTLTRAGFGGLNYKNVESFALIAGPGANTLAISSTAGATSYEINAGLGNDAITVGNGNLDSCAGAITLQGGGGTDELLIQDAAAPYSDPYTITPTSIARIYFTLTYLSIDSMALNAESGGNNILLAGTSPGTPMTINGDGGADSLTISAAPASPVIFNGGLDPGVTDTLNVTAGTYTFDSDANVGTAKLQLNIGTGGNVVFNASQHLAGLSITGGSATLAQNGSQFIQTGALTIASGYLDLQDNDMIVTGGTEGTWSAPSYTGILGLVQSGRNGGAWNGSGIRSSLASGTTTLGVASAGELAIGTFDGQVLDGSEVLIKYTYQGDANLDGKVNIDDYGRIDAEVSSSGTVFGWFNGDFNFDGKINIDDYGIIDSVVGLQGPVL